VVGHLGHEGAHDPVDTGCRRRVITQLVLPEDDAAGKLAAHDRRPDVVTHDAGKLSSDQVAPIAVIGWRAASSTDVERVLGEGRDGAVEVARSESGEERLDDAHAVDLLRCHSRGMRRRAH
jgi:hypothetical protein